MDKNRISSGDIDSVFKLLSSLLKTPEERNLFNAQADKYETDAIKAKHDMAFTTLRNFAEILSLEVELLKKMNYSEDKIRELVGPKLEKLVENYEGLITMLFVEQVLMSTPLEGSGPRVSGP